MRIWCVFTCYCIADDALFYCYVPKAAWSMLHLARSLWFAKLACVHHWKQFWKHHTISFGCTSIEKSKHRKYPSLSNINLAMGRELRMLYSRKYQDWKKRSPKVKMKLPSRLKEAASTKRNAEKMMQSEENVANTLQARRLWQPRFLCIVYSNCLKVGMIICLLT